MSAANQDTQSHIRTLITRYLLGTAAIALACATLALQHAGAAGAPLFIRLLLQLPALALGVAGGVLIARVMGQHLRTGDEREHRFRTLLAIGADGYWEMDAQYRLTLVSPRRPGSHDFVAKLPWPRVPPWELPMFVWDDEALDAHRADLEQRRRFRDLAVRVRTPQGKVRHFMVSGEPRFSARGVFLGYWGVTRDITSEVKTRETLHATETRHREVSDTERKEAEDAVRRSEALLAHLVATSPDVITLIDMETGCYAMVNKTFTRLSGYGAEEVIGRTVADVGIWNRPDDRERIVAELRERGAVRDLPTEFVAKSGRRLSMLVSAARFVMDGHDYLVINARDVTEHERERLEREAILNNASIGIALMRDRRFVLVNPAFEQMVGWPDGSLVGQSDRVVWPGDAHADPASSDAPPVLARGEQAELEVTLARRDGSTFLCRLLARAVDPAFPERGGTIWIAEDITERRAVAQALAKARDDAEAASRAKSAFLANTSHEIRTPLNGLMGLARLARMPDIDEGRRRQYLEQIGDSAQTLSDIISDILDLSKIEAGKLHVESVPFDPRALLGTLHRGYTSIAHARNLVLEVHVDADVPATVLGDPVRLRQILGNYLSNALKFTARGGVWLSVLARGQQLRFEVHDSGPGIDVATQARLFHPFTQADESTTRRFGGTGLGLSICRELARLMQGCVGVDSEPGSGSCFWAELPLPATDAPASNSGFGALDGNPLAGARVLLVEDNEVNMMVGAAMLQQWGVDVAQASDGMAAIDEVERAATDGRPFDAVLMDVQMPVMSGHEATLVLRQRHDPKRLPIIALTAAALTSERDAALSSGMNDFLTKPIDAQRLRDTLSRLVVCAGE